MNKVELYAKAFTGSILAGLTALATALVDNSIVPIEWVTVAIAFVTTFGAVWAIPNKLP